MSAPQRSGEVGVRVVTWSTRLVAVLTLATVLMPQPRGNIGDQVRSSLGLPPAAGLAGVVIALVAGVGLLVLATGLRRRKRRAWQLAVALAAILTVSNILHAVSQHGRGLIAGLTAAALLAALVLKRRWFVALPDPTGLGYAVRVLGQLAGSGFGLVWLLLAVNGRRLAGDPSWSDEAAQAGLSLIGVSGPVQFRVSWLDDLTATLGLTLGVAAVLAAGYFLLRSPEPPRRLPAADELRLRELLVRHGGGDSLGYFALRSDKSVAFSPSGKAAVAYRVLAGVALASGDPVGDIEAWPGAITAYLELCRCNGWVPAVLGCSERGAIVWGRRGLVALELGDEAVLDVAAFCLDGRPMRGIRQAVARLHRGGYVVRVRRLAELPPSERAVLAATTASWRGARFERGYSMALSRVGDTTDPACVLVTAERDGAVSGLLQLVPWGTDGLSLDAMRRNPQADNGLTELMIAELFAAAPQLGVRRVSLNFAVFRAALERGERIGAGPVARLWARLLRVASRWWQIESLYRFNAKFRPQWVPRFLVFPGLRELPRIAIAALEAEGFGGRPPALLRLLHRRGAA